VHIFINGIIILSSSIFADTRLLPYLINDVAEYLLEILDASLMFFKVERDF